MKIGDAIHCRRTELGLTLEDIGKAVGVGKSTVKKWETGYISNMRRDRIDSLANVLRISPLSLVVEPDRDIDYQAFCSTSSFSSSLSDEYIAAAQSLSTEKLEILVEITAAANELSVEDLQKALSYIQFLKG